MVVSNSGKACNCGGGGFTGGGGLGLMSRYQKNFAALSWEHKTTDSRAFISSDYSSHYQLNSVEAIGKYFPIKRLYISAILPYQFNMNDDAGSVQKVNGFGDITLSSGYSVLKSNDSICKKWDHSLTFGAGVKMPTGKYRIEDADGVLISPYLQPGTGSWDVLVNASYSFNYGNFGFFSDANYQLNTVNNDEFKFGNRFSASLSAFYRGKARELKMIPSAGMMFENLAKDKSNGIEDFRSGGSILFATVGLDFFYKKIGLGFNYFQPTFQQLGSGYVKSKTRWQMNLSVAF